MKKEIAKIRKELGMPKFERECKIITKFGRKIKAYKVGGTPEHGKYSQLLRLFRDKLLELKGCTVK